MDSRNQKNFHPFLRQLSGYLQVRRGGPFPGESSRFFHRLPTCLQTILGGIQEVIRYSAPQAMAVENIFYGKNIRSLIKQGHVRGVAILAGADGGMPIYEYSPLEIKKAVVGYGRAEKGQVQRMVRAILKLPELPPPDAADALAVAICHIHFRKADPI